MSYRNVTGLVAALACALLAAVPATAQEPQPAPPGDPLQRLDLPPELAEALVAFYNDAATLRLSGPVRVPAERTIAGDVAILGGPVELGGRVDGRLAVINGDVELLPGAVVTGDLMVVGGRLTGLDEAHVAGEVTVYAERLDYARRGDRITGRREGAEWWRGRRAPARGAGRSDFIVATGQSYNRVEGLPITFGPVIETASANPLRVRAMGIYRTESGATFDDLGYYLRVEQLLGGRQAARVGGTLHSMVSAIEDWHLTDLENGLSTFLLHRDFRDHYTREGGSLYGRMEPRGTSLSLGLEARWERHRSEPAGSPWALFGEKTWRDQPLVGEGRMQSAALQLGVDSRSSRLDPAAGWWVRSELEQIYYSTLTRPAFAVVAPQDVFPPVFEITDPQPFGARTVGHLDVRRYNRLGPDARLNVRLLAGGSLDRRPLPPQRQHAFGGEGSLPGFSLFSRDCGARAVSGFRADEVANTPAAELAGLSRYFPRYGCDAFALVQAEYRGRLSLRFNWDGAPWGDRDDGDGWSLGLDAAPDWVVFVDAGRGWAYGAGHDEPLSMDLGLGLLLHRIGVYAAVPLTGRGGLNVFIRLGPRF